MILPSADEVEDRVEEQASRADLGLGSRGRSFPSRGLMRVLMWGTLRVMEGEVEMARVMGNGMGMKFEGKKMQKNSLKKRRGNQHVEVVVNCVWGRA